MFGELIVLIAIAFCSIAASPATTTAPSATAAARPIRHRWAADQYRRASSCKMLLECFRLMSKLAKVATGFEI